MIKATSGSKIRGFDGHPWKMMDRQWEFWVSFFPTSTEWRLNMREKQMQRSRFVYSRKLYIARLSLRALQNRRWSDWVWVKALLTTSNISKVQTSSISCSVSRTNPPFFRITKGSDAGRYAPLEEVGKGWLRNFQDVSTQETLRIGEKIGENLVSQEDKDSNLPETSKSSFSKSSFGLDKTFSFKAGWGALWIFAAIHAILTKNAQNYCGWLISSVWKQRKVGNANGVSYPIRRSFVPVPGWREHVQRVQLGGEFVFRREFCIGKTSEVTFFNKDYLVGGLEHEFYCSIYWE